MSKSVNGFVAGWLDPSGTCHYVNDTHTDWAARFLKIPWNNDESPQSLKHGIQISDKIYNMGWVRIMIYPSKGVLYFDTLNIPWKKLTRYQRRWLYDTSTGGYEIMGNKILSGTVPEKPYLKLQFGYTGADIPHDDLIETKLSFSNLLTQLLTERMSFRALLAGSESGRQERGKHDVNVRPIKVITIDGQEAWTFRYKSNPSTTGNPWHGYVQFFKDDVSKKDSADDLDCMVDCDCPDYRFRYAYNNAKADVGRIGRTPDWRHGNDNNGQKWKPRSQGGVGDFGVGLCKHLCALSEYLKTKIEPDAPEPEDKPQHPVTKPSSKQAITPETPTTTDAPEPGDTYSDSRTGSLQEGVGRLYEILDRFAKSNPSFDVMCEDDVEKDPKRDLMEDYHHLNKEYRLYEGNSHIIAVFEDNSKLKFEVHYHNKHGEDREKHRRRAFTTWKSLASEIHGDVQLSNACNPVQKSWKDSFKEALEHPKLQEYIRQPYHQRVYDDKGYPKSVQGKPQAVIDPVNFTKTR
jgi:hypothetical protein